MVSIQTRFGLPLPADCQATIDAQARRVDIVGEVLDNQLEPMEPVPLPVPLVAALLVESLEGIDIELLAAGSRSGPLAGILEELLARLALLTLDMAMPQ